MVGNSLPVGTQRSHALPSLLSAATCRGTGENGLRLYFPLSFHGRLFPPSLASSVLYAQAPIVIKNSMREGGVVGGGKMLSGLKETSGRAREKWE